MKKHLSLITILFLSAVSLFPQEDSARIKVIASLADSPGIDQKWEALHSIASVLEGGNAGDDLSGLIGILSDLSVEGTVKTRMERGMVQNDFPRVRLEAVRLLGQTGSAEAMGPLLSVLRYDPDVTILSEASLTAAAVSEMAGWERLVPYYYQMLTIKKKIYHRDQLIRDVLESVRLIHERDPSILDNGKIMEGVLFIAESELGFLKETKELALSLKAAKGL